MEPIRMDLEGYSCPCPGTPHPSEWVELEPAVTATMGMAAMYVVVSMADDSTEAELRGLLTPILLRFGIRDWSFREGKAQVKINDASIARLLPFSGPGFEVADRCMDLYLAEIIAPLAARRARLLEPGQTADSTSPTPASHTPTPISRTPSSPATTAGKPSEAPVS